MLCFVAGPEIGLRSMNIRFPHLSEKTKKSTSWTASGRTADTENNFQLLQGIGHDKVRPRWFSDIL
jgi:hypothetical protein